MAQLVRVSCAHVDFISLVFVFTRRLFVMQVADVRRLQDEEDVDALGWTDEEDEASGAGMTLQWHFMFPEVVFLT